MSKYKSNINLADKNNTLTKIVDSVKSHSLVLDIGCSSGYLDEILVEQKTCRVIGIEPDIADAKEAEKFCEVVLREDIELDNWKQSLKDYKFDHIILADVLEHLKDPKRVLEEVKPFLKDKGTILISVPNISHISVRLELLKGEFIPEEVGILDNTHLKYFTKNTMKMLIESAGYSVAKISPSTFEFPEIKIKSLLKDIGFTLDGKAIENLTTGEAIVFQYFFEISKGNLDNKTMISEDKPLQIVKNFLKTVEKDHRDFKRNLDEEISKLRNENLNLSKKNKELEDKVSFSEKSFGSRLIRRVKMFSKRN